MYGRHAARWRWLAATFVVIPGSIGPDGTAASPERPEFARVDPSGEGWRPMRERDGVAIFARLVPGERTGEVVGRGRLPAPPCRILELVRDHARLHEFMPYLRASILKQRDVDGDEYCQYLDLPWPLSDRRYDLRSVRHQLDADGCRLALAWHDDGDAAPCSDDELRAVAGRIRADAVRPPVNLGYWHLVATADGRSTEAEYYVRTDPGGRVPASLHHRFIDDAVLRVFQAIRGRLEAVGASSECACSTSVSP